MAPLLTAATINGKNFGDIGNVFSMFVGYSATLFVASGLLLATGVGLAVWAFLPSWSAVRPIGWRLLNNYPSYSRATVEFGRPASWS